MTMTQEEKEDRAYIAGMLTGWNCAVAGAKSEKFTEEILFDDTRYQQLVAARRKQFECGQKKV